MTIPALEKTWTHSVVNYSGPPLGLLFTVKEILKSTFGFTVIRSRAEAGASAYSDTWLTAANVVAEESWILMQSPPGLATPWYLCMKARANGAAYIAVSTDAFLLGGGVTSTMPTSSYQTFLSTQTPSSGGEPVFGYNGSVGGLGGEFYMNWKLHLLVSSDNKAFRFVGCTNGNARFMILCEEMGDNRGAVQPNMIAWMGPEFGAQVSSLSSYFITTAAVEWFVATSAIAATAGLSTRMSYESALSSATPNNTRCTYPDAVSGGDYFGTIGLFNSNAAHLGRRGRIIDLHWGSVVVPTGTTSPGDGSRVWIKMGDFWFPACGDQWDLG